MEKKQYPEHGQLLFVRVQFDRLSGSFAKILYHDDSRHAICSFGSDKSSKSLNLLFLQIVCIFGVNSDGRCVMFYKSFKNRILCS